MPSGRISGSTAAETEFKGVDMQLTSPWKRIAEVCAVAMCLTSLASNAAALEDDQAAAAKSDVVIQVREFRLRSFAMLDRISGQLEIQVSVTNNTGEPLILQQSDFGFEFDGKAGVVHLGIVDPLLTVRRTLPPDGQATGWLALHLQHPSGNEPRMLLTWNNGDRSIRISLNDALRNDATLKPVVSLLGPDNCLAVVGIRRSIDHLAIWILNDEFQRLRQQGLQRVVLHAGWGRSDVPPNAQEAMRSSFTNSSAHRAAVASWLASASSRTDQRQIPFRNSIRSPVQFRELYAVDDSAADAHRSNGGFANVYQPDRERAVAAALGSVYENVSEDEALKDLHHPEAGVRRVALQATIDRLTSEQLQQMLMTAAKQPADQQALIAENLYRTPLPEGVTALAELAGSPTPEVSGAAVKSLVRSPAAQAVEVLRRLWTDSQDQPQVQQQIVMAIIEASDFRHTDLLADYAEQQLKKFSATTTDSSTGTDQSDADTNDEPSATISDNAEATTRSRQEPNESKTLHDVLTFLRDQDQKPFEDVARRELLNIVDPKIQDIVLEFVLNSEDVDASDLAREYIQQRLPPHSSVEGLTDEERSRLERKYGALGPSSGSRITARLIQTIKQFPDATYTARLRELSSSRAVLSSVRREAYQAAIRCADDQQLNDIIDDFIASENDSQQASVLLSNLAMMRHPRYLTVSTRCLSGDDNTAQVALTLLATHQSPEAMQVMIDRLEELSRSLEAPAKEAADSNSPPAAPEPGPGVPQKLPAVRNQKPDRETLKTLNLAKRILENLTSSSHSYLHPETHRVVNRLRRSSVSELERLAYQSFIRFAAASPTSVKPKIKEGYELQKAGKYRESKKLFEEVVAEDPYCVLAYSTLASLNLREGLAQEAMDNLRKADELSPEDTHTQSMIALADIRLGNIRQGIEASERILTTVPDLPTSLRCDTLYNTACTYGRAIEVEANATLRQQYTDRAIELLNDCASREAGFADVAHLLADPDLNVFHDHPEWKTLVKQIGDNEKKNNNVRP
ncbi:MAG: HEAT repeat domain-containing protein [Planctomycetaceae bacterium]